MSLDGAMLTLPKGQPGAGGYREHDILVITEDPANEQQSQVTLGLIFKRSRIMPVTPTPHPPFFRGDRLARGRRTGGQSEYGLTYT